MVCFPGNPVSTQLSFRVFLEPHLRRVAGLPRAADRASAMAVPTASVVGKRQFLRGRRTEDGRVELVSGASSHLVAGYAAAERADRCAARGHRSSRPDDAGRGVAAVSGLSHIGDDGRARMVDVGAKAITRRTATAIGDIRVDAGGDRARRGRRPAQGGRAGHRPVGGNSGRASRRRALIPLAHALQRCVR